MKSLAMRGYRQYRSGWSVAATEPQARSGNAVCIQAQIRQQFAPLAMFDKAIG